MPITGSKTSSTEEFIKRVKPDICLIGVGKNNNFGHPNEMVLERFKASNTRVYRTDQDGEIFLLVNKKGKIGIRKFIE